MEKVERTAEQEQQVTSEITADDSGEERRECHGDRREREDRRDNRRGSTDDEYIERVVAINHIARVVKGGRNFSFCTLVVAGDGEGMVGVGYGKAKEVPAAIAGGVEGAKRNFFRVSMIRRTIVHEVLGEGAARVVLFRPASPSTGVIAGDLARALMGCAGVHDTLSKSLGSSNAINTTRGAAAALRQLEQPEAVAACRGLSLEKVAPAGMLRARAEGEAEVCKNVEEAEAEAVASGVSAQW